MTGSFTDAKCKRLWSATVKSKPVANVNVRNQ